jgi:hypothetical protein
MCHFINPNSQVNYIYFSHYLRFSFIRKKLIFDPPQIIGCLLHYQLESTYSYSKCHVTSNKANSNLECAEDKFQKRGWV